MDLEQQLKDTYAERLDALGTTGGDVVAARQAGARMRVRRRLVVGAAAAAVVAVAVGGSLVGTGHVSIGPAGDHGQWRELPAAPLSPRAYAVSVWNGHEVIVLGGETDPCSLGADCASTSQDRRDGAAYDPATNRWHRIADAPVPVGPGDRLLSAGGRVVLRAWQQHGSRLFLYDPDTDTWSELPSFFKDLPSSYGDVVYGLSSDRAHPDRVLMYDVEAGSWNDRIPRDPNRPRLNHRRVTATPYGPVVTGYTAAAGSGLFNDVTADLYDGRSWHRLPAMEITGNDWAWAGDRMIEFDSFEHQGVNVEPGGRQVGGQLDPRSGGWSPLPDSALETPDDGWSVVAIGPGRWAASWGLVYDVSGGEARALPRPDQAPDIGVTASWAGDRLVAFGGATFGGTNVSNRAWLWTP